ncbi:MAG: coproporphyrinogen dehydrogenase HemZ [Oscillospiraceae bacterium]
MEQYALIFKGHSFGYEVQAIAKIFIPAVRFTLCENGEIPDNISNTIFTEIKSENENTLIQVDVVLHGKHCQKSETVSHSMEKNQLEWILCQLLYDALQELTGYTPPWGLLTGIRPVRKVIQALESGLTPQQACEQLQTQYRISDKKMKLAMKTALIQKDILPHSPKEIGLYISIPFCPTRCSYCSFVSHSMESAYQLIPAYIEKLCQEIAILGKMIEKYHLLVQSVYIGGGTPTSITAEQLQQVMQAISEHIDLSHAREYTVEAGRADTITPEKLQVILANQADRISVNPQTLQDSVLQAIGRRHTAQQAIDAFQLAREMGFDNINMDLIAGLPTDTFEGFSDTLHRVMSLQPDSITVHTLTVKRSADLYHAKPQQTAISEVEQMAELSADILPKNGWMPYYLYRQKNTIGNLENVGYAKAGKENLYNILIMDETQTILGVGCGASSKVIDRDGDIHRVLNYKFPYEYINRFEEMMQKKDQIETELEKL